MKSVVSKKKLEVNDALIKDLDEGKVKFDELDAETTAAVTEHLEKLTEMPASEDDSAAQADPAEVIPGKQDESVKPPKGFVEGSRFKEKADEASDYQNKWKAEQAKRLAAEAALAAAKQEPIAAPSLEKAWSDEGQIELHTTVADLKRKLETYESERTKSLEEIRTEKLDVLDETELHMLRADPLAKTLVPAGKSLKQMEAEYSDFYYATGATEKDATNVKKFFEDANFRKEMEAKGVKAPKDFEAINTVLQVKAIRDKYRVADPEFKMTDAYVHFMAKNNKLSAMMTDAHLKGAAQVADKIHGIANETITMQPGLTSGATSDNWSDVQMTEWLNKHPHPKTAEEKKTFKQICDLLDAREEAAANS